MLYSACGKFGRLKQSVTILRQMAESETGVRALDGDEAGVALASEVLGYIGNEN